ncbi:MAG: STAS domain-containing protein [Scytolyngbya sp. HA4215-MV1]|jgi:anti-anti-sigma factor|nr:STAS domain-containing protein [Scytolyngbya sp. HA4215-MV1]
MQNVLVRPTTTVICPSGAINAANANEFECQLTSAVLSQQDHALLIDMGKVESLDSAGLMALVSGLKMAQRFDRRLGLCSITPAIRIILELTQLDQFEVFDHHSVFETLTA